MRRVGARFGRRGSYARSAAPAVVTNYGFRPVAGAFTTANPGGEAGSASGFGVGVWCRIPSSPTSATRYYAARGNGSTAGWVCYSTGTITNLTVLIADGGGTARALNMATSGADFDKLMFWGFMHTGSALRALKNTAQVGSDFAVTGYTALSGAQGFGSIGGSASNLCVGVDLLGCVTFTGTPSVANWASYANSLKATGTMPLTFPGATVTHTWDVGRDYVGPGLESTLVDNPGANNMTVVGTAPTLTTITGGTWAY